MSVSCVECREVDHPLRIVPLSFCEHRVCMGFRRADCRQTHTAVCPPYCAAIGRAEAVPVEPVRVVEPVQLDLFSGVAG